MNDTKNNPLFTYPECLIKDKLENTYSEHMNFKSHKVNIVWQYNSTKFKSFTLNKFIKIPIFERCLVP